MFCYRYSLYLFTQIILISVTMLCVKSSDNSYLWKEASSPEIASTQYYNIIFIWNKVIYNHCGAWPIRKTTERRLLTVSSSSYIDSHESFQTFHFLSVTLKCLINTQKSVIMKLYINNNNNDPCAWWSYVFTGNVQNI